MADVTFAPLYPDQTEEAIAARWEQWANEGVSPGDDDYVDTQVGSMWWLITRVGIREAAVIWDRMGTEVIAAAFPQWAWGVYLDDHAEARGLDRNEATLAVGSVLFTGPATTVINPGQTVYAPAADSESDPIEYQTTSGGTINAALAAPTGVSATLQAGGTLVNGTTYRYVVTAVDDAGETVASAEVNAVAGAVNKQVLVDWADIVGARYYRVYRKTGTAGPPWDFLVQVVASTYTDTGAVGTDAARHPPAVNGTGGKLALPVVASETGAAGNVGIGAVTGITPPIQDTTVTNIAPMLGGADTEGDEPLRVRVATEFDRAGGANALFYEKVALDFPGVGRVTVIGRWAGTNTVLVIVGDVDGQPVSAAIVSGLQALLDPTTGLGSGDAPVGAEVTVQTSSALDITVTATIEFESGYSLDGDTAPVALRLLITNAISAYIRSVKSGTEVVQRAVVQAIMSVPGVHDVSVALSPGAGGNGNIAVSSSPPKAPRLAVATLTQGAV